MIACVVGVDRNGEAEPCHARPTTAVLMPTTRPRLSARAPPRVARVERGVGLDDVLDHPARPSVARPRATVPRARTTPALTEPPNPSGLPIGDDELPDPEPRGVAELGRGEAAAADPHDGQVATAVGADDLERAARAVGEHGAAAVPRPRRRGRT